MRRIVIPLAFVILPALSACTSQQRVILDSVRDPGPPATEVLVSGGLTAFDEATECNAATTADCPPTTGPEEINPPPTTEYNPAVDEYNPATCVPASTCTTTP